jgi:hypothetical protein
VNKKYAQCGNQDERHSECRTTAAQVGGPDVMGMGHSMGLREHSRTYYPKARI